MTRISLKFACQYVDCCDVTDSCVIKDMSLIEAFALKRKWLVSFRLVNFTDFVSLLHCALTRVKCLINCYSISYKGYRRTSSVSKQSDNLRDVFIPIIHIS